ncbi:hypothetical protein Acr_00g0043260 [Actinidia rufa]|uniref:Uncharacterized protein n=1 Tax=Actinidia rufa TaxID=165716 RepID=A0A7J0DIM6_9ERIC|nr:hypothetical protein Acr_00g0043260 [Actinidia rufa]
MVLAEVAAGLVLLILLNSIPAAKNLLLELLTCPLWSLAEMQLLSSGIYSRLAAAAAYDFKVELWLNSQSLSGSGGGAAAAILMMGSGSAQSSQGFADAVVILMMGSGSAQSSQGFADAVVFTDADATVFCC